MIGEIMTKTLANRDLPKFVQYRPSYEVQGYGNLSYTPRGYSTGYLPYRIADIFTALVNRDRYVPTIYSYGTPIAWFDRFHQVWIRPDVNYSVTTAKHQGYLYQLDRVVTIPWDCGSGDEYEAFASGRSTYDRWKHTVRAA